MSEIYTFRKRNDTTEIHIFSANWNKEFTKCTSVKNSICGAADRDKSEIIDNSYNCLEEQVVREKAAEIGRAVCGNCIKEFYTTYEE